MNKRKLKQAIWAVLLFIAIVAGLPTVNVFWQIFGLIVLITHSIKTINLLSDK